MSDKPQKSIPTVLGEVKELSIAYAKQETLDPIKGLGRYIVRGVGGAFILALGLLMVGLAGLRFLQTETGSTLTGNWSWVPYLAALIFLLVFTVFALVAIKRANQKAEKTQEAVG